MDALTFRLIVVVAVVAAIAILLLVLLLLYYYFRYQRVKQRNPREGSRSPVFVREGWEGEASIESVHSILHQNGQWNQQPNRQSVYTISNERTSQRGNSYLAQPQIHGNRITQVWDQFEPRQNQRYQPEVQNVGDSSPGDLDIFRGAIQQSRESQNGQINAISYERSSQRGRSYLAQPQIHGNRITQVWGQSEPRQSQIYQPEVQSGGVSSSDSDKFLEFMQHLQEKSQNRQRNAISSESGNSQRGNYSQAQNHSITNVWGQPSPSQNQSYAQHTRNGIQNTRVQGQQQNPQIYNRIPPPKSYETTRKAPQPKALPSTSIKIETRKDIRREVSRKLENLEGALRDKNGDDLETDIVEAQRLLLELRKASDPPTLDPEEVDAYLIIGVDATPAHQAGYCLNLKDKVLHYYVLKRTHFPFTLKPGKDPSEFEMKNLMFALLLWQDLILKHRHFRIYTDNYSITQHHRKESEYGKRAFNYLSHLIQCKKALIKNEEAMHVNKYKNLEAFAKFLKPADDLSRWKINEAVEFLSSYFDIKKENIIGTHEESLRKGRKKNEARTWYNPTSKYDEVVSTVKLRIKLHRCRSPSCSKIFSTDIKD